jgi:hypothetical protein
MRRSALFVVLALTFALTAGNDSPWPAMQSHGSLTEKGDRGTYDNQTNSNLLLAAESTEAPTHANSDNAQSGPNEIRQNGDNHKQDWVSVITMWVGGISAQSIFNLITMVATVFLAIFTCQLVIANRGMREANERANRLAREALHIAERAYVNVEELKVVSCEVGKPLEFSVTYVNTGRTPATGLDVVARDVLAKSRQGENDIPPEEYRKPAPPLWRGFQLGGGMRGDHCARYHEDSDPADNLPLTQRGNTLR